MGRLKIETRLVSSDNTREKQVNCKMATEHVICRGMAPLPPCWSGRRGARHLICDEGNAVRRRAGR